MNRWIFTNPNLENLEARVVTRGNEQFALTFWDTEANKNIENQVRIFPATMRREAFTEAARRLGTLCECGEGHPDGTLFFVSCVEDEGERRKGLLLGPYATHAEALVNVERGAKLACGAHPKAHWYSFGTCSISEPTERKGMFGK